MKITLPDQINEIASTRAAERGHKNLAEYVEALIAEDSESAISLELEQKLLANRAGPARELTSSDWQAKQHALRERLLRGKGK